MNTFKIGTASIDITPPLGTPLCGYAKRTEGNSGVLDNLFCKVLVINVGSKLAVLVCCDLIGLDNEFIVEVRVAAENKFNLEYNGIMISCTHTHSGPATMRNIGIGEKNYNYLNELHSKILDTIDKAINSLQNSECFYYKGKSDIGMNRRGIIEEGNIEPTFDPEGFVDDEVSILVFYKEKSKDIISILYNYGCHPTVLEYTNNFISADFPGAACRFIEEKFNINI